MARLCILIFSLICSVSVMAQKISVQTNVVDSISGNALPYATLTLKKSKKQVVSDRNGTFRLEKIDSDETVRISYIGYKTLELEASAIQEETILSPADNLLSEITILPEADTIRMIIERANKAYLEFESYQQNYRYLQETTVNGITRNRYSAELVCNSAFTLRDFRLKKSTFEEYPDSVGNLAVFPNFIQLSSVSLVGEEPIGSLEHPIKRPMLPLQDSGKQFYKMTYNLLCDGTDTIIALHCVPKKDYNRQTFVGTLYFDHRTFALLKAKGELLNTYIVQNYQAAILSHNYPNPKNIIPLQVYFTINYTPNKGCSMVENVSINTRYVHNGENYECSMQLENHGKANNHTAPLLRFSRDLRGNNFHD